PRFEYNRNPTPGFNRGPTWIYSMTHMVSNSCGRMRTEEHAEELTRQLSASSLVKVNEGLARKTTLRVGGPADLYGEPASEEDLSAVLAHCHRNGLPFFVLGRGSNLLIRDRGFRGVVICLAQPVFSRIEVSGVRLRCGAGAKVKAVAVEAK